MENLNQEELSEIKEFLDAMFQYMLKHQKEDVDVNDPDVKDIIALAKDHLVYKGEGQKKICFVYNNKVALKIVKRLIRTIDMKEEIDTLSKGYRCFANLLDYDKERFVWYIMELCKEQTKEEVLELTDDIYESSEETKYPLHDILFEKASLDYDRAIEIIKKDEVEQIIKDKAIDFLQNVKDKTTHQFAAYNDLVKCWKENKGHPMDVFKERNVMIRDGENKLLVIVDVAI